VHNLWQVVFIVLFGYLLGARALKNNGSVSDDKATLDKKFDKPKSKLMELFHIIRGNKYYPEQGRLPLFITETMHILNAVLVYFAFGASTISFMAAIMFMANPFGSQIFIWKSGKPYSTAMIGVLLMFICPWAGGLFWCFSLWGSAGAIFSWIPFVLLYPWWWLLSFIPLGFFAIRHVSNEWSSHKYLFKKEVIKIRPRKLITAVKTFGYYFRQGIMPCHLGWDTNFLLGWGHRKDLTKKAFSLNIEFWWGIVVLAIVGTGIVYYWGGMVSFCLIWWFSNIMIWTVTGAGRAVERYHYIASAGLMMAIATFLSLISPIAFWAGTTFLIGCYAMKLYVYTQQYATQWWQLQFLCIEQPTCTSGWIRIGCDAIKMKNLQMGLSYLKEAERVNGGLDFVIAYNLSNCFLAIGDLVQAKVHFEISKSMKDERTDADYSSQIKFFEELYAKAEKDMKENGVADIANLQLLTINVFLAMLVLTYTI